MALLLVAVTVFYATVLFGRVTIQWDAVTYYYPYQKHFADELHAGKLPFWTSTLFSGFPFLADLQVGAWYPLNWPFFLTGIHPQTMFQELWLHAGLAAIGAFLLGRRLIGSRVAGVLAGLIYGLSGYFTAHGEHVGLFQAASYLPLMLYLLSRALDEGGRRNVAALTLAGGAMSLAGHFQTALYIFTALALWTAATVTLKPGLWRRGAIVLGAASLGTAALAAIQVLPSAELLRHSLRSQLSAKDWTSGMLEWRSLATFVYPNAQGALNERYTGPPDITQHYFYAGALLLPLALLGLRERRVRRVTLWLIVPAAVYALGPAGLLFRLVAELPGFSSIRAPSHAMFVPTLGLALLAASGATWLSERLRVRHLTAALCVIFLADLWYWNMHQTRLMYAMGTYEEVYGPSVRWFRDAVKPLPPLERIAAPGRWTYFYPADSAFDFGAETTFGSNALLMSRYYDFMVTMNENSTLMSALGVRLYLDPSDFIIRRQNPVSPRFSFPERLVWAREPLLALKTVDASRNGVLAGERHEEENGGSARVLEAAEDAYTVRVSAPKAGMMRMAIPWFPGWSANVDGRNVPVQVIDHALMALALPAGDHEIRLSYRSTWFATGAVVTLVALLAVLAALLYPKRRSTAIPPAL